MFERFFGPKKQLIRSEPIVGDVITPRIIRARRYTSDRRLRTALHAYNESPNIRAVVSRIAERFAAIEWEIYEREEIRETHDGLTAWQNNSASLTHFQFKKTLITHYDTAGETFLLKVRDQRGVVRGLYIVPPTWVTTIPSFQDEDFVINPRYGVSFRAPVDDVIWIKDVDPLDPYGRGHGAGISLADEIAADEYAAKHAASTLLNNARPDIIVSSGETGNDQDSQWGPDEAKALAENWVSNHGALDKRGKPMFTSAKIKVDQLSQSFTDLELVDLRRWERDIIISTYGIPPEVIGVLQASNRATIESAEFLIAKNVLLPRARMICDALNQGLAGEFGDDTEFRFVNPVADDKEFQLRAMQAAPYIPLESEWRALQGLEEVREGNRRFVPFGLTSTPAATPIDQTRSVTKQISDADIEGIVSQIDDETMAEALRQMILAAYESFGEEALTLIGAQIAFNAADPVALEALLGRETASRIVGIGNTTRESVRRVLAEGQALGESIETLADRVQDVFAASNARATMIATTEIGRAQNIGLIEGARQGGADGKEWSSVLDGVTRPDHVALDGQVVPLDDVFRAESGITTPAPQQSGIAEFDINCRCVTLPVIGERTLSARDMITKNLDDTRAEIERGGIRAIEQVLSNQAEAVLAALKERS